MKKRIDRTTIQKLLSEAKAAKGFSYAPYSNFHVGAAVLGENGEIYTGCNVENASYGLTICAERAAIFNAVSNGIHKIKAIAIWSDEDKPCSPCGACRQVIYEFSKDALVIVHTKGDKYIVKTISEMLPMGFSS